MLRSSVSWLFAAILAAGCTDTAAVGLVVTGDGAGVARYTLRIHASARCPSAIEMAQAVAPEVALVHEQSYPPGGGRPVGELPRGTYSFALLGRTGACVPHRFGCTTAPIAGVEQVRIPLAPVAGLTPPCPEDTSCDGAGGCRPCPMGECPSPPRPPVPEDAGGERDAGEQDAGPEQDGGMPCPPGGCVSDPCSDNVCETGTCCPVGDDWHCADLAYDPFHCGTCDVSCAASGALCRRHACYPASPRSFIEIVHDDVEQESLLFGLWWWSDETDVIERGPETGSAAQGVELDLDSLVVPSQEEVSFGVVFFAYDLNGDDMLDEQEIRNDPLAADVVLVHTTDDLPPGTTLPFDERFVFVEGVPALEGVTAHEIIPTERSTYDLRLVLDEAPPRRFSVCESPSAGCPPLPFF